MSCLLAKIGCGRAQTPEITSDTPHLNKWYFIDPKAEASSYENKALAANALGAICAVAGLIFACSFVFFSFMATAGTAAPVSATLGYVAAIPLIYLGAWLCKKGKAYNEKAEEKSRVAKNHAKLVQKELRGEVNFYNKPIFQGCGIERPSQQTLKAIADHLPNKKNSAENALKAWLLILAQFKATYKHMRKVEEDHSYKNLKELPMNEREVLYVKNRGYKEAEIYANALQAALLAQILKDPFTRALPLDELGDFCIKSYTSRKLDKKHLVNNDYFIFNAPGKAPIELDDRLKIVKKGLIAKEPESLEEFSQNFKSLQAHLLN